jgi:hypothetical protein
MTLESAVNIGKGLALLNPYKLELLCLSFRNCDYKIIITYLNMLVCVYNNFDYENSLI